MDSLDAITSDRPYHEAPRIRKPGGRSSVHAGTQFNPLVVEAFLQVPSEVWSDIRLRTFAEPPRACRNRPVGANLMPAQKLLKDKDARFRLLFEDNPQPMWVFDRETLRFLEVNQAAVRHYDTARRALNMTIRDIRPRPEDVPRLGMKPSRVPAGRVTA